MVLKALYESPHGSLERQYHARLYCGDRTGVILTLMYLGACELEGCQGVSSEGAMLPAIKLEVRLKYLTPVCLHFMFHVVKLTEHHSETHFRIHLRRVKSGGRPP